jgi:3-isopropylmalate dehydrogenase
MLVRVRLDQGRGVIAVNTYHIVVIRGDGIGPEIVQSAVAVLDTVQQLDGRFRLVLDERQAGAAEYRRAGRSISDETLAACRAADAVLKGPVGLPDVRLPDGTEAGLLGGVLRIGFDLYANVRPIRLLPGISAPIRREPGEIDYVIVRENTEGLYASRGRGVANAWAASDVLFMTRPGVERICRFAFELARRRGGKRRVTCVDKSNVLRSFGFFRSIFEEIAAEFPEITADTLYADAAAQALVMEPDRFDVLVMENFLGDILSDLGGGTTGGIGLCPSANIGDQLAYFEPIHGSAPSLAGQDRANPLGQILAAAMLLDHLGEQVAAQTVDRGVEQALRSGRLRIGADGCPVGGTHAATEAIISALRDA